MEEKVPPGTGSRHFEMGQWISCAPFERLLYMTIVEACDGMATLTTPFFIDYAQGAGPMHGGALVSLADTAAAMGIKSIIAPQSHFATIELESRFLLTVKKGIVTATAGVVVRKGRQLKGKATVYDEDGRAVLECYSTFKNAKDTKIEAITFKS